MLLKVIIIIAVFMTRNCLQTINNAGKNVEGINTQLALPIEMEIKNYVENACMYV
jgi:hypothetical protein